MKKLSILFAALMACTLSFAQTDYSKTYTSNAALKAGDNASAAKIVIGETTVDGMKAGTKNNAGSIKITVPANSTNLHIHAIAWKGTTGATVTITGATCVPASLTLADNSGITNNSPFTISGDMLDDYYFNVALTDITAETELTLTSTKRFVVFGVNAVATADVPATAIALDQTTLELEQYKHAKLTATLTPVDATTTVTWTSSNEAVATVSSKGVISALTTGTTTITATAGELTATCAITVKEATAITCAQAVEIAKTVSANNEVAAGGKYVIRGYVTELAGTPATDFENYGNYSVWMADTKDGGKVFEAYQVAPTDGKTIAAVGDYVEVIGDITKYNTTYETVGKTGTITVIAEPVEPTTPAYCQTEVGHFLAENADPNSYILLSIGSKDGKTIVRIDQDTEKNTKMFDYLQVTGLVTAGADVTEGGEKAMAVEFDTPAADAKGNITLEILWSTIGWEGRWMIQNLKVSATAECEHAVLVGPGSAINNATIESNIVKRIENGILVIEKDGVRYNAQGVKLN